MLLLFATAVLSCEHMDEVSPPGSDNLSVTVTGTVSDKETKRPVEEIRITLHSSDEIIENGKVISSKTVYSDNDGTFTVIMGGYSNPVSFIVMAEDPNGVYESVEIKLPLVTWESDYNVSDGMFYVNGCNFHLEKAD